MARQLSLAVVGVGFPNKKGQPSRRFEIALCAAGDPIELRPEPNNPADPRAIAVYSKRGGQLGYVRAERAQFIGSAMARGGVRAIFQRDEAFGCTIRVSLDGSEPVLPADGDDPGGHDWPPPLSHDTDWWPDEEYPED